LQPSQRDDHHCRHQLGNKPVFTAGMALTVGGPAWLAILHAATWQIVPPGLSARDSDGQSAILLLIEVVYELGAMTMSYASTPSSSVFTCDATRFGLVLDPTVVLRAFDGRGCHLRQLQDDCFVKT
jgi:hypothetical protein